MRPETKIFWLGLLFRILLLVVERIVGIGTFFHVDSQYYFDQAQALWLGGYDLQELWHLATTNGYVILVSLFFPLDIPTAGPIVLNLLLSVTGLVLLYRIALRLIPQCNLRAAFWAVLTLAVLPYHAHLSIHLLKDTTFIFLSILLLWSWLGHRVVLVVLTALALFSVRSQLAMMELLVLMAASILRVRFSWTKLTLFYVAGFAVLAFTHVSEILIQRGSVQFEGRAFFPSLPVLRAENLFDLAWMGLIAPVKSIVLPNLLFARNFSEIMYALDVTVSHAVLIYLLLRPAQSLRCVTSPGLSLLLTTALGGFWFVEMTTPSYGPLVRYREYFWILFSFSILYCFFLRVRIRW